MHAAQPVPSADSKCPAARLPPARAALSAPVALPAGSGLPVHFSLWISSPPLPLGFEKLRF